MLGEHFVEGAVLYGHSLGAWTAMIAAAALPELVRGVILEDPPGEQLLRRIDQTPFHALFTQMRSLAGHRLNIADAVQRLAAFQVIGPSGVAATLGELRDAMSLRFSATCLRNVDPAVLSPLIEGRWLDGIDVQKTIRAIACPALLLYGDEAKGGMLSGHEAKRWASEMRDACAQYVPGGHLLHWLERETVIRHMLGFLETLEPCEAQR
jgi:pimeloyl-ACP methyl ester carboxylesterase